MMEEWNATGKVVKQAVWLQDKELTTADEA